MSEQNYETFEDLETYKVAREFRKRMYRLANRLPDKEKFNLATQVRSAARSVTNNIAEGYGRFYFKENLSFQRKARGSLNELIDDINICLDEGYFAPTHLEDLKKDAYRVLAFLNGYMHYLKRQIKKTSDDNYMIREASLPYGEQLEDEGVEVLDEDENLDESDLDGSEEDPGKAP